jgi:ribosomal protein L21E
MSSVVSKLEDFESVLIKIFEKCFKTKPNMRFWGVVKIYEFIVPSFDELNIEISSMIGSNNKLLMITAGRKNRVSVDKIIYDKNKIDVSVTMKMHHEKYHGVVNFILNDGVVVIRPTDVIVEFDYGMNDVSIMVVE